MACWLNGSKFRISSAYVDGQSCVIRDAGPTVQPFRQKSSAELSEGLTWQSFCFSTNRNA
jgi:hypothetical protein